MQEKVYINDLSVLYVSPGRKYGTLEKRAIEDALFFRDIGGKPKIFCLANSITYQKALENDLEIIVYKKIILRNFDLNYYLFLKNLFTKEEVDLVHCYGLRYLWVLAFSLRKYQKIGLFVTLNKIYSGSFRKPLYRFLCRRVDTVFCFSERMKEMLTEWLPIHKRKLIKIGAGIDFYNLVPKKSLTEGKKKIGSIIPFDFDKEEQFSTLINSILPMLGHEIGGETGVEFYLYSEVAWAQMPCKQMIVDLLHGRGIDYKVFLKEKTSFNDVMGNLDLYIGISTEPLDVNLVNAMVRRVPVVVPRNGVSEDLWIKNNRPFETYHWEDSRELKYKCLKILDNYDKYLLRLDQHNNGLIKHHSLAEYINSLSFYYNKVYSQHISRPNKL